VVDRPVGAPLAQRTNRAVSHVRTVIWHRFPDGAHTSSPRPVTRGKFAVHAVRAPWSSGPDRETGVGLIEIVVAMMLLMIISVAVFPSLIQGLKLSAANATFATATSLVNDLLEDARSKSGCAAITPISRTTSDPRGVSLKLVRTVGTCSATAADYPAAIPVSVTVTRMDTGVIISARTSVYVEGP
jgi:type II secretory pathway pseudopilin PulG